MKILGLSFGKKKRQKRHAQAAERAAQSAIQQRKYILSSKSNFYIREAYKALRTNITFSVPKEGCRKVCVTSAMAHEGKSITCLNLALSFSETGQRVLLIDADLRKPNQGRLLEKRTSPGLSNLLAGLCTVEEAVNERAKGTLDVIFSGDIPPNPSELLGSPRMEKILEVLATQYDYIFIDTPPVNVVTDASVLATLLDGVIFVVRQGESEYDSVSYAINQLIFAEAKVLGFVLNGVKPEKNVRYSYRKYKKYQSYGYKRGYGYGYGYGHGYGYRRSGPSGQFMPQQAEPHPGEMRPPEGGIR